MKMSAIVLAMVLSATTMFAQALAGYAGLTAQSGTAATGAAHATDPGAGLHKKMAAAMGDAPQTATATTQTQNAPEDKATHSDMDGMHSDMKGMHSGMHCKEMHSGTQGMSGTHCKRMHGAKAGCSRMKDSKTAHACCKHRKCDRMKKESETKS
jgi:hypothetical protein